MYNIYLYFFWVLRVTRCEGMAELAPFSNGGRHVCVVILDYLAATNFKAEDRPAKDRTHMQPFEHTHIYRRSALVFFGFKK